MRSVRRYPVGAELLADGGVHFRVWAPRRRTVEVVFENRESSNLRLTSEDSGYFTGWTNAAGPGDCYRLRLDSGSELFPDPASRFQPQGPHGPSQIIDPTAFPWTDSRWRGVGASAQVIYEMHIGTFTPQGTWDAATRRLDHLADLGVTLLELLPVADFAGRFGWGYDGVCLFAPTRLYGSPDDFRRFVDRAHTLGLGVLLDVVYNHLGPAGNYLPEFSETYFSTRYRNEWGDAINFDGPGCEGVREFMAMNAAYWIDEFHLDGLRLDATQQIYDSSDENIQKVIVRRVREAARGRATFIVAENEPQQTRLVRPVEQGGFGMDALWNDDFHHSARVAMTGRNEAYYTDYHGTAQELLSAVKWGYLYQGQRYKWQKQRRGTPALDLAPTHFVTFLQNHDQVANSGSGLRCHQMTSPGRYRAMTALLLLGPNTPMLFQGQEFAASTPFLYFADHEPELARSVREGRAEFLRQFPSAATPESQAALDDPGDPETFRRSMLDWSERERHANVYELHRDLLRLRREDPAFAAQQPRGVDGAVFGPRAFVLRYFRPDGLDRLLLINLGRDLPLDPAPEPLLAPPEGMVWTVHWSSEDRRYGGLGTPPVETEENWRLPGEAAVVMVPSPISDEPLHSRYS